MEATFLDPSFVIDVEDRSTPVPQPNADHASTREERTPSSDVDDDSFGSFVQGAPISTGTAASSNPSSYVDSISSGQQGTADPLQFERLNLGSPTPSATTAQPDAPTTPTPSTLAQSQSKQPASQGPNTRLVDEIMKHEADPNLLFSEPLHTLDEQPELFGDLQVERPPSNPITTQPPPTPTLVIPSPRTEFRAPVTPKLESNPANTSPTTDPAAIIQRHLGLIDDDYFNGREPAETIPVISAPPPQSRPGEGDPGHLGTGGRPNPSHSPSWSFRSLLSSSFPSPTSSRAHTRAPSLQAASFAQERDRRPEVPEPHSTTSSPPPAYSAPAPPILSSLVDLDPEGTLEEEDRHSPQTARPRGVNLPAPRDIDLPTPVTERPSGGGHWRDGDHSPERSRQSSGYGTLTSLPAWVGSFLWGDDEDGYPDEVAHETHAQRSAQTRSSPMVSSPSPIDAAAPSGSSSPETAGHSPPTRRHWDGHAHGKTGRPLPKARPSLESIQFGHDHVPHDAHRHPQRPANSDPQPVTITHSSPFMPPSSPTHSFSTPITMNTGFGSSGLPSGYLGGSTLSKSSTLDSNPFAPHTFNPIPGAPGFKPEEYDWDKGFSEELERELEEGPPSGGPSSSGPVRKPHVVFEDSRGRDGLKVAKERDRGDSGSSPPSSGYSGFGSRFFGFKRAASGERSSTGASSHNRHHTDSFGLLRSAPNLGRAPNSHPTSSDPSRSPSRSRVPELIEKKMGSIVLSGRKETTDAVLTQAVADLIRPHLPPLSRLSKTWGLLYSIDQHGISLKTLYNNCEAPERNRKTNQGYVGMGGAILVIKDSESESHGRDSLFGAFIADGFGLARKSKGFFGGGDSFLWKYANGELRTFKATGRNTYFAICESGYMGFGGGSTSYGLYIDENLEEGSSAPSPTFGNEVLCSGPHGAPSRSDLTFSNPDLRSSTLSIGEAIDFECVGLEVWGVGPS